MKAKERRISWTTSYEQGEEAAELAEGFAALEWETANGREGEWERVRTLWGDGKLGYAGYIRGKTLK